MLCFELVVALFWILAPSLKPIRSRKRILNVTRRESATRYVFLLTNAKLSPPQLGQENTWDNLLPYHKTKFSFFFFYVFCRTKNFKTSWVLALLDATERWKDFLCVSQTRYSSEPLINIAGDYGEGGNIYFFRLFFFLICKINLWKM